MINFGRKIKDLRQAKGMSLEELAKLAHLTPSFISQLERNVVSPSVASLRNIAAALGIKMSSFFTDAEFGEAKVLKESQREKVVSGDSKTVIEVLNSDVLSIKMEPLIFVLRPGGSTGKNLSTHDGEEFGFVLEGEIEVILDKQKLAMEKGDSICFNSLRPHRFRNIGKNIARVLWVVLSPRGVM